MAYSRQSFGMHFRWAATPHDPQTPWHDLGFRSVRLWDTRTAWRLLEPTKGQWTWTVLDANISLAVQQGCHIIYTLGQPPTWATNDVATGHGETADGANASPPTSDDDWVDYIQAIVPRFPTGTAYEVWNEPNLTDYYSGTVERLIELHILAYDTIKAIDPSAIILNAPPSGTGQFYLKNYLPSVADYTDVVGYHAYTIQLTPEDAVQRLRWVRHAAIRAGLGSKPMWNTEHTTHSWPDGSGPATSAVTLSSDESLLPEAQAAAYAARHVLTALIGKVERTYFYGMDHWWSAIRLVTDLEDPTTLTDAATALRHAYTFLDGATISRFRQVPPLYTVDWSKNGESGRILWCDDDETQSVDLTEFTSGTDVLGDAITLSASYEVTHSPVFVTR